MGLLQPQRRWGKKQTLLQESNVVKHFRYRFTHWDNAGVCSAVGLLAIRLVECSIECVKLCLKICRFNINLVQLLD